MFKRLVTGSILTLTLFVTAVGAEVRKDPGQSLQALVGPWRGEGLEVGEGSDATLEPTFALQGPFVGLQSGEVRLYPPVTIQASERRELRSNFVDDVFKIHVHFPRRYEEMEAPLPVVYLLDAEYSFGAVGYIIRRLIKDGLIPPVLLVGVAYEVPYDEYYRRRERDFTPTAAHLDDFPHAGHAEAFARFLREELIPFVNRTYRVDPDDRTIIGLSFSGLFSTYVLFREPDLFDRYVITSPSLWWDDGVIFRYESEYSRRHTALPARAFFAAGEDDGQSILRDLRRTEQVLSARGYGGLDYRVRLFPDETHRTVFPMAVSHGLRFVFADAE